MRLFAGVRQSLGRGRILRQLLRAQQQQTVLLDRLTAAVEGLAATERLRLQQELGGGGGLITGLSDGKEESGVIRGSDREIAELLEIEAILGKRLGRAPSDEETVASWEQWKRGEGV